MRELQMKPTYATLKSNHYSSNKYSPNFLDSDEIYTLLGYSLESLRKQNPDYVNTCAVRMSLALIESGVHFVGRMKIKDGPHKGKTFEPGAKLLADQLARPGVFGRPDIIAPSDAMSRLSGKKGLILFWKIAGYGGGHIDLIDVSTTVQACNSACYFSSKEIWFWPLS